MNKPRRLSWPRPALIIRGAADAANVGDLARRPLTRHRNNNVSVIGRHTQAVGASFIS